MRKKLHQLATRALICLVFVFVVFDAEGSTSSLSLSGASGAPGSSVTLDMSLTPAATAPSAIQFDVTYVTSDLTPVSGTFYTTGAAASGAGKTANCGAISASDVRCIISGLDQTAIGSGVLATLTFKIVSSTTDSSTIVSVVNPEGADGNANALALTESGATVLINQAGRVATTTSVGASVSTIGAGSSTILTATVSASSGTTSPSGNVSFSVGSTVLGTGPLSGSGGSATASLTISGSQLGSGANTITATYAGNSSFNGSSGTTMVTVAPPPSVTSVSPNYGAGASQNFAFALSDLAGASDIQVVGVVINSTYSDTNGCFLYYSSPSNLLYLLTNSGAVSSGMTIGSAGTLSNSQCSVNVGSSSVAPSGNTLTLHLALTFSTAFVGMKNIYVYVQNATVSSGWVQSGSWTVPAAAAACSIAIDRGGMWYVDTNHDFQYDAGDSSYAFGLGLTGASPVIGPWHTSAPSWLGVYDNATWFVDTNGTGAYTSGDQTYSFGFPGAYPVVGDWTHSGVLRIGAFVNGVWYVDTNNDHVFDAGDQILSYGIDGDYPVLGDWGNTGTRKIGVYRGNGVWVVDTNADNVFDAGDQYFFFGFTGAIPVVGDWTGNGVDKIGVFDPTTGYWYLDLNGNGTYDPGEGPFIFGQAGDQPAVICPSVE